MGLRLVFVASLLCRCAAAVPGSAELSIALSPAAFSAGVTELTVTVYATDPQGLPGTGEVALTVDVGTITPDHSTLDSYGAVKARWSCTPGCEAGGKVTAVWGSAGAAGITATRPASFTAAPMGTGGGAGGGGGGTGPFTTQIDTGSNWRLTAASPTGAWQTLSFGDSGWGSAVVVVPAGPGVGAPAIWDQGPTTSSGSVQIWVRHLFSVPGRTVDAALLDVACNDDMSVWINGTQVVSDTDGANTYKPGLDVRSFLVPGDNVIAATCRDVVLPDHSFWSKLVVRTH